jgi:uncharacterized protein (DUF433 family)
MTKTVILDLADSVYTFLIETSTQSGQTPEQIIVQWVEERIQQNSEDPLRQLVGIIETGAEDQAQSDSQHLHIEIVERYGGPQPVIKGTRITVSDIIGYLRLGETPESLVNNILPQLTLAQIHDAISYYYDHQDEIEKILEENTEAYGRAYLRENLSEEGYRRLTGQQS